MNVLRRRLVGGSNDTPTSSEEPSREGTPDATSDLRVVSKKHLKDIKTKSSTKAGKRRSLWIFALGGLFGLAVAAFFVGNSDMLDMQVLSELNLDNLIEVLPSGLLDDVKEIQKHEKDTVSYDSFAVGLHAKSEGISAKHPVVMIPGVISTGLESWSTEEDSRQYFRKRLWGSWSMMRALVMDKAGWKKHIMLNTTTGRDPNGVKLRAAQGFDATDFFITGYWIWNKILENLATIGYDPNTAFTAAYDWRMSYDNYEKRDQYFTRLKAHIEIAVRISGTKAVLLSHSMGSQVLYYFFHWVEAEGYGNGNSTPNPLSSPLH
jgi:phospholipid:diacylglycerol acyltransferase